MNYLKSFVKGNEEAAPSGEETIAKICSRVASSTLLDDRRDAVRALKSLSKKFQQEVGTQALPHLVEVLKTDSNDDDIVAYALETLCNLATVDDEDEESISQPEVVASFIERFIEVTEYPIIAIQMIEKFEFSVRWPAIRLLAALLRGRPTEVQQIVLVMPMGISRIMDLLADNREVVRNDTLLALIELVKGNPNIQKIVAFENGFESIFNIILEEGLSDGGVVVEDCLLLLLHLLKNNTSNQQFFKEGSLIQRLTPFFDIDPESNWTAQKGANFHLMLKVIRTLVSPSNPTNVTSSCQIAMQQCIVLQRLSEALMSTGVPSDILTETINTVSELLRGCNENQIFFASVTAPWNPPRPALVVLLMSMVNAQQPFALRSAVLYCFQCYLYKNPDGQSQVISTLLPSSLEPQDFSLGQLLCGGLFAASDPLSNWLAATALSHALRLNEDAKQQLLRVQLATAAGSPPVTLLRQITNIMQQTTFLQTRVGLLCLLCSWLTDCSVAVAHFLDNKAAVSFLLSQVAENGSEMEFVAHGICSLLLGICVIDNDGSVQQYTKESLIELIAARVGIDRFCDALSCVNQCELYTRALQRPQPAADKPEHLLFSHSFAKLFKSQEDLIVKTVSNLEDVKKEEEAKAAMKAHDSIVNEYKSLIREQDLQLAELKAKCQKLESDFSTTSNILLEKESQVQQLKDQYNLLKLTQGSTNSNEATTMMTERIEILNKEAGSKDAELNHCRQTIEDLKSQLDTQPAGDATPSSNDVKLLQEKLDALNLALGEKDKKILELTQNGDIQQTDIANDGLIAEKASLIGQLNAANEKCASAQLELQRSQEEKSNLLSRLSALEKETEKRDKSLAMMQEEYESVKKEQDDLLVLLDDQGEKLRRYKLQLKSLGGEVSAEEEEEEEDGDEEDFETKSEDSLSTDGTQS